MLICLPEISDLEKLLDHGRSATSVHVNLELQENPVHNALIRDENNTEQPLSQVNFMPECERHDESSEMFAVNGNHSSLVLTHPMPAYSKCSSNL